MVLSCVRSAVSAGNDFDGVVFRELAEQIAFIYSLFPFEKSIIKK
jgi:hypothetical protein